MKVITVTEKTSGVKYDIMIGTGLIFDYQNKKVFNCTDDTDEAEWSDKIFTFEIEGKEVIFYLVEVLSYDTIKDIAEVIRIQEMEHDLDYMKSQREKAFDCCDCNHKQGYVNVEPCKSCKDYCNHSKNKVINSLNPPIDDQQTHNWIREKVNNPKTLNTKTGCLEPLTFEKLIKTKSHDKKK